MSTVSCETQVHISDGGMQGQGSPCGEPQERDVCPKKCTAGPQRAAQRRVRGVARCQHPAARREVGTGRTWRSPCDLPVPEALTQAGETTMSTYSLRTPHIENHCFPQPRQPAPVLSARKPLEMSNTGKAQGFRTLHGHFEQVLLATSAIPLLGGSLPGGSDEAITTCMLSIWRVNGDLPCNPSHGSDTAEILHRAAPNWAFTQPL